MHRVVTLLVLLAATVAAAMATAPIAHAATVAANYSLTPLTHATGAQVERCRGWGGDADEDGRLYTVCLFGRDTNGDGIADHTAPALVEFSPTGRLQRLGWLPPEYWFGQNAPNNYVALDVGVSPDGSTAYVSTGPNIDNLGQSPHIHPYTKQPLPNGARAGAILRLRRQADGSWAHDAAWRAGPFMVGGNYWAARRLDVDAVGRPYVSVNAYVFELHPGTGAIVSNFGGGTTDGPGGRWIEGIDKAQGLSVAADGSSIYVVEQQHQIVQRWLRVGAADWRRDTSFLLGTPDAIGDYCSSSQHFQSPYDVGVDAAGDVYVMDTTCNRVQRFTRAGAFVQTVWQDRTYDTVELSHGFGVNWQGSIVLPTARVALVRTDPPARPLAAPAPGCVDRRPPGITSVIAPRRSTTRTVRLQVQATDDCGVTHVRVLGHRRGIPGWVATTSPRVSLSGWNGRRTLRVQVRDRRGAIAERAISIVLALPQPPLRARSTVQLAGSGCSSVPPMRRVASPDDYVLVDRCARLSGRVVAMSGTGAVRRVQLLLPTVQARAIYSNAVGPVRLWVVTDARTRIGREARVERVAVATGSIIATRDLTGAFGVPVDRLAGT